MPSHSQDVERIIRQEARRFRAPSGWIDIDELMQEGRVAAWVALRTIDPGRPFQPYVRIAARNAMIRAVRAQMPPADAVRLGNLSRCEHVLRQQFGREPSLEELARAAGVTREQVDDSYRVMALVKAKGLDELGEAVAPAVGPDAVAASSRGIHFDDRMALKNALNRLMRLERSVLEICAFDGLSSEEAADKLRLSSSGNVRRILALAKEKVARWLWQDLLGFLFTRAEVELLASWYERGRYRSNPTDDVAQAFAKMPGWILNGFKAGFEEGSLDGPNLRGRYKGATASGDTVARCRWLACEFGWMKPIVGSVRLADDAKRERLNELKDAITPEQLQCLERAFAPNARDALVKPMPTDTADPQFESMVTVAQLGRHPNYRGFGPKSPLAEPVSKALYQIYIESDHGPGIAATAHAGMVKIIASWSNARSIL